jgi:zinc protease
VRSLGSAFIAFVCAGFGALAILSTAPADAAPTQWPQATSDLPANPNVTFGTLPNGMRYAIRHNDQPKGMVSMRLVIEAGSMQETHEQEGLAHLLEHMAFRGSTHVPDGEVVKTLERLGLRFGADTNAQTGPLDTVYQFDLPQPDAESVDTGLHLMREIASELTFSQAALDGERKVVLAEARQRDTPDQHLGLAQLQAEFPGHPFARLTIGRTDVVDNATPAQLRTFYDAYYRPERAVLVVVGDVDPKAMEAKIAALFSDWQGRGSPGGDPPPFAPGGRGQTVVVDVQPGASISSLSLVWLTPYAPPDETRAGRIAEIVRALANSALGVRIFELKEAAGHPFVAGGAGSVWFPDVARGQSLGARDVDDLSASVDLLIKAQRQVLAGGLTQTELDHAVAGAREALQQEGTDPPSGALASQLAGEAAIGKMDLSKAQRIDLFEAAVKDLTVARVTETLRSEFEGVGPIVFFVTDKPRPPAEPTIAALMAKANAAPLVAYTPPPPKPWPYTNFGPAGSVAERRELVDLGVTMVRFADGVRLTVRPTKDTPGQFRATVRFGHGRQDQPRDHLDASDWSTVLLVMGGVADLSPSDIGWTLQGRSVSTFANEDDDAWAIETSPFSPPVAVSDLDLEMQYLTAMLTAPGWRSEGWKAVLASTAQQETAAQSGPGRVFDRNVLALLHPGDERWVYNTTAMRATWTPEQVRAFIEPIMQRSQVEVIVVGDVSPDQAIAAVAKTFGALPARRGVPEPAGARVETFPAPTATPVVLHHKGQADQAVADISWPTTDRYAGWDDIAPSVILADILKQRVLDQLRTADGVTYTVNAGEDFSPDYPGWGRISLLIICKPQSINRAYVAIDAIAADLAAHPVSADELDRAVRPEVDAASRSQQSSGYWVALLAGAQTDPRRLDYIRQTMPRLSGVTAADVQRVAKRWLRPDRAFRIEVLPDPSVVGAQAQAAAAPAAP